LARIAERIRTAYDRAAKGDREWIAGTLELAEALPRLPTNRVAPICSISEGGASRRLASVIMPSETPIPVNRTVANEESTMPYPNMMDDPQQLIAKELRRKQVGRNLFLMFPAAIVLLIVIVFLASIH
jgi:hypothetical protein